MPALPWTSINPGPEIGEVVVLASRLELPRFRMVPRFMRMAMRVHRATKSADGAIGATLLAQPARRTFWTLSAWVDDASLRRFVGDPVHREAMKAYRGSLRSATFTTWTVPAGTSLPPTWDDARAHIAAAAAPSEAAGSQPAPTEAAGSRA